MKRGIIYLISAVLIILIWQYFGSTNNTVRLYISSPSLIIEYIVNNHSDLLNALLITLLEASLGLFTATIFSFSMMILCFRKPILMDYLLPVMIFSQVIPLIVLAPLFIVILGIGITSKVMMAAVISFFPVFINFAQGYKGISDNIHGLMKVYNAPLKFRIFHVYFPLSMPSIIAGLKVSATLSVIGAIVAEFSGAEVGLGKNLFISAIRLEPDLMMSSLILSTLIGFTLFGLVRIAEKRFCYWVNENGEK